MNIGETKTIYKPKLEVCWDDSVWDIGSSTMTEIPADGYVVYIKDSDLTYKETSGIQDRWSRMSSEELDAIAEEAAYAKGLGYDDVLPNQFDYSDETALMAGIRMRAEEDLEDKLGANGYDDAAVDRWVEAAVSGLKGGQMLDVSGNIKNLDPNEPSWLNLIKNLYFLNHHSHQSQDELS